MSKLPNPEAEATCLRFLRAFEPDPCRLDSHLKHILRWRRTHLSRKNAFEVRHAHRHAIGQIVHREFRRSKVTVIRVASIFRTVTSDGQPFVPG
jgi:hypothetical protein